MAEFEYAPRRNVKKSIEKCKQPQRAAESDHIGQIEQFAQWRNRQREDQEAERPIASLTCDQPAGDGIKIAIACCPHRCDSRNKRESDENGLCPPAAQADIHGIVHSLMPAETSCCRGTMLNKRLRHERLTEHRDEEFPSNQEPKRAGRLERLRATPFPVSQPSLL